MPASYQAEKRKQAAIPVPDAAKLRARVIKKLLAIVEGDERPEAVVQASRVLLDLPAERERTAEGAQSSAEDRREQAAKLIAEAFAEITMRPAPPLPEQAPPGEPVEVEAIPEAVPAPVAEVEAKPVNVTPAVHRPVVPFARKYGRKLNRGY